MKNKIQLDPAHIVSAIIAVIGIAGPIVVKHISPAQMSDALTALGACATVVAYMIGIIKNSIVQPAPPVLPPTPSDSTGGDTDSGAGAGKSKTSGPVGALAAAALMLFALACNPSQWNAVFTAANVACQTEVLITSKIPPGTPASVVAQDIEIGCDIATALEPQLEQIVTAFENAQSANGAPAASVYVPSPIVATKRAMLAKH